MKTNQRSIQRMTLLTLAVLTISLAGSSVAHAGVKVRATVRTPYGAVRIGNHHGSRFDVPRRKVDFRITRQDKRMAKRLARYTGVSTREILRLRRQGYRWGEIGRRLDVSRRVVRAARNQHSWQRFLRLERRHERCRYDDNDYWDR